MSDDEDRISHFKNAQLKPMNLFGFNQPMQTRSLIQLLPIKDNMQEPNSDFKFSG